MRWWCAGCFAGGFAVSACGETASNPAGSAATGGSAGANLAGSGGASAGRGGSAMAGTGGGSAGASTTLPNGSWIRQLGSESDDKALAVGVDASNNVLLLLVHRTDVAEPVAPSLEKFDSSGTHIRSTTLAFAPSALAVHPNGDTFVIGAVDETNAMGSPSDDVGVARYDPDGNQRWSIRFGSGGLDGAFVVNVDPNEHAFVLWGSSEAIDGSHRVLSELDPEGNVLSSSGIAGMETTLGNTVDRRGNVLLAGGTSEYAVRKYDTHGGELWAQPIDGTPRSLFGADDDNVLAVGLGALPRQFLSKLDSGGNPVFHVEFGEEREFAGFVAADSAGRSFAVGGSAVPVGGHRDVLVWRFDDAGGELGRWPFGSDQTDNARAIAVDSTGALLVVGDTDGVMPGQAPHGVLDGFVARVAP